MNPPLFIFFFQGQDLAEITGLAQIQEAADALAAAGLVGPELPPGVVREAPDTLVATGEVAVTGEAAIQEAPDTTVEAPVVSGHWRPRRRRLQGQEKTQAARPQARPLRAVHR